MTEEINDTTNETNTPLTTEEIIQETPLIQETPKVSAISIGDLLKNKRLEKGLNLKTISQQTKIHMGLLEHLENNDLAKLPSKTYVRGFVKSAAKILGINQEEALEILETTYNRDHKANKKDNPSFEMRNEAARNTLSSMAATPLETVRSVTASSTAFLAKAAVGILIIGVIGFNVKNLIDRSAEERLKLPQVLSTIHQKIKPPPKIAAPKVIPKTPEENAILNPIKVNIIQDKKDTNQKSEVTINDVNLKTISLGEKQFTEDNSLAADKLEEVFPSRYKVKVTKGVENVFINAIDGDSWLTYKVDDKDVKKYVLRQGRTVFLRGGVIRLFLGNTKSVKVFYNNKLINLNAKNGIKNLVLPEELKTKYMSPLFVFQKDGSVLTSDEYIKTNQSPPPATTATPNPAKTKGIAPAAQTPSAPTQAAPATTPIKRL